ncbi:MAG: glycoside hydrolase family 99-like domain-containing protein, partial [Planctomycetes bacterium]|nr:glycoside hydrolase family 99-like domain-containing protein [Planctomycetota bacterium]
MQTEVAAFYFPNWHVDPRNERWHGRGWTEWDLVRNATPRYPGHRQPIVPAWGYCDEADPAYAAREIDLAADHGVTTFLYDWYWYEDGPYLNGQLDRGFLAAPNRGRMKYALMWANHAWMDIHPVGFRNSPAVLDDGRLSEAAWERMTDHIVAHHFTQPNHLRVDGCPFFSIYDLGNFIASCGGLDGAARALDRFRAKVRRAGMPGLHLNIIVWGNVVHPGEHGLGADRDAVLRALGADSGTAYVWVHYHNPSSAGFPRASYARAFADARAAFDKMWSDLPVPFHPNVTVGWDSSPRTVQSDRYEDRGYPFMGVLEGNTPAAFAEALTWARDAVATKPGPFRMITLNAWNEWTEGSYLLPDTAQGTQYLEQVRAVFGAQKHRTGGAG